MIYFTEHDIDRLIEDDVPMGDMTSLMIGFSDQKGSITLKARSTMVVSCSEEAKRMYLKAGLTVTELTPSGSLIEAGDTIIKAEGYADAIHLIWRTGSAMLEFASGIATRTYQLLDKARKINPQISLAGTRKHPPYLKKVAIKSLLAGGGVPHRTGLSDTILIFKEYLLFAGGYSNLPEVIKKIKVAQKERKIVVEAHSEAEAILAVQAGAHAVQFDKLPADEFQIAGTKCRQINPNICVIAAGGVNGNNAEEYTAAGADVLVSSWMYFAPPADIKAEIVRL